MKNLRLLYVLVLIPLFSSYQPPSYSKFRVKTIVIDPGHGGSDPGAVSGKTQEKDIALDISLKLGKMISDSFPDIKVIYTRKTDVFVELYQRAEIANKNNANLFICIHCNFCTASSAYGTETFTMGVHKNDANLEVAKRENSVILLENNYQKNYDGFDPNSPEANIIFSLYQNAYINQSISFASKVEAKFKNVAKRYSRGVKQAGFLVLWKTAMPSILIETGFISNPKEKTYLLSDDGKVKLSEAIYSAFKDYKKEIESGNN